MKTEIITIDGDFLKGTNLYNKDLKFEFNDDKSKLFLFRKHNNRWKKMHEFDPGVFTRIGRGFLNGDKEKQLQLEFD